jgi:predicted AlkP superfamily phosphohydrolase/phosphomutase
MIESTFPPDSICAWASIYTGENPAEHGLIENIDYLSTKKSKDNKNRSAYLKGKTFWDIASNNGKKVCIINPFVAYPAWEVNGIMVSGPVFESGDISAYPKDILSKYDFPPLGGIVDFPKKKELDSFLKRTKDVTEQLAEVGLKIYKDQKPDLFFLTFLTLDRVKHFLWRFTDKEDINYPGETSFKNAIKDFYIIFDSIIGRFKYSLAENTTLLVISDHGHRRRCSQCLNLNEILRQKGYLVTNDNSVSGVLKKLIEKIKVFTIESLSKYGFQDWIYKIAKFIPNRKALKKSTYLINREISSVTLSNLCGTNPYGGLDVKAGTKEEYEKLRENVIDNLLNLNEIFNNNIIRWAKKREQIYSGKYEERLPDILFELDEEYGVGMDLFTPIITPNYTHKKISGGHKREAVLLRYSNNETVKNIPCPMSVAGLYEYILKIVLA